MNKILFLDVDGVLNTHWTRSKLGGGTYGMDPGLVANLVSILDATGAKIVLSSTWRLGCGFAGSFNYDAAFFTELKRDGDVGQRVIDAVIDCTVDRYSKGLDDKLTCRGDEIRWWLDDHPEVDSIVVLDDDSDIFCSQLCLNSIATRGAPWDDLTKYHVKTNFVHGLSDPFVRRAISILDGYV